MTSECANSMGKGWNIMRQKCKNLIWAFVFVLVISIWNSTSVMAGDVVNPISESVDKSQLQQLVDENAGKEEAEYSQVSWHAFDSSYEAAYVLLQTTSATQEEVDLAVAQLQQAVETLVTVEEEQNKEYAIHIADVANGKVTVAVSAAKPGTEIEVTVEPIEGYVLQRLYINEQDSITNVFVMPSEDVTIRADFMHGTDSSMEVDKSSLQSNLKSLREIQEETVEASEWEEIQKTIIQAEDMLLNGVVTQSDVDEFNARILEQLAGATDVVAAVEELGTNEFDVLKILKNNYVFIVAVLGIVFVAVLANFIIRKKRRRLHRTKANKLGYPKEDIKRESKDKLQKERDLGNDL